MMHRIVKWLLPLVLIGIFLSGAIRTPDVAEYIYPDSFYKWHVKRAARNLKKAALELDEASREGFGRPLKQLEARKKIRSAHLLEMEFMLKRMEKLASDHSKDDV